MTGIGTPCRAVLRYDTPEFDVIEPGEFVSCAVTGKPIPLDMLIYWSAEAQEAYFGPEEATAAWLKRHPRQI